MKRLGIFLAILALLVPAAHAQIVSNGGSFIASGGAVSGCTGTGVLYMSAANLLACGGSPAPSYDATNIRLKVGAGSTTQAGWLLGYLGASGFSGIWPTSVTPDTTNPSLVATSTATTLNTNSTGTVNVAIGGSAKTAWGATAGLGPAITAGAATTDVQSLSTTQTWNAAGVTFTGHKYTVTETAAAAGSLHSAWYGGAAGATTLMSLSKSGGVDISGSFTASGSVLAGNLIYWSGKAAYLFSPAAGSFGYSSTGDATQGFLFSTDSGPGILQLGVDVNGAAVAQTFKAHDGITGTDIAGANLTIAGGRGTGAGTAGNLRIQTAVPVSTGTTAQALSDRELFVGKPRSVADNTATTLFTITLGDDTDGGGIVDFCSMATSATTDRQKTCGQIAFSGVDITAGAGGETCSAAITGTNSTSVSVGTLTVTAAATTGTDLCNIQITSDSSLNVAHLIRYSVRLHPSASTVVITPQ